MAYYDTAYISKNDILRDNRQFKLTNRTSYKLLETGILVEDGDEFFIIRLTKNAVDSDGKPCISYVDLCKDEFDDIVKQAQTIKYFLKQNMYKTVYQNKDIHVWVKPSQTPLVCIRGEDGTKINMIERTFDQLIKRIDWVEYKYGQFTDDQGDESYDTEDSDDSYDDYSDDSEYSDDDY